jgi:hypothetical protein
MRVLSIGRHNRATEPEDTGHLITWAREVAPHVDSFTAIVESPLAGTRAFRAARNSVVYFVPGSGRIFSLRASWLALRLHSRRPFSLAAVEDPLRHGTVGSFLQGVCGLPLIVDNFMAPHETPEEEERARAGSVVRLMRGANSIRNCYPEQNPALVSMGIPLHRIHVVPSPVDATVRPGDSGPMEALGIDPYEAVVLTDFNGTTNAAREAVYEALAEARRRRSVRLLVFGDEPQQEAWEDEAKEAGVQAYTSWLGYPNESEREAYFRSASIYINAATHEAGAQNAIRALAAGVPVVAEADSLLVQHRLVISGETGLITRLEGRGLAERLDLLLSQPDWRQRLGEEGRRRVDETHSYRVVARHMSSVWRETVRRTQGNSEYLKIAGRDGTPFKAQALPLHR